jgi:putative membrane protein
MVSFSPAEHERLRAAVATAETRTSAEIVLTVAERSDDYAAFPWGAAATTGFIVAAVIALAWPETHVRMAFLVAGGCALLAWLMLRWPPLLLKIVPQEMQHHACMAAARAQFTEAVMGRTQAANGLLIFISVAEHYAAIIPDSGIVRVVPPETWAEVIARLITRVRAGTITDGLVDAVAACTDILAAKYPPGAVNPNEISDDLTIRRG